ncbi:myb-like protein X isoform X2 [Tachysurus fulvidraco]|uniref:myb-like protein X isoform X2 n=1 Tax=Tachysurus fulvidraco TaxID=1234273 RepID=UPI001FED9A96|nr:myb-like protein X isoform X2 [Tachysurus fulvidraco]
MEFPVDILANVDPGSLEQTAKSYMSKLLYRNSEIHEYLNIPGSKKVEIGLCNVSFVPLYGIDLKQKILALFSPEETLKAVGLYLLDQWWSAEDILKTADSSRTGLIKVRTPGERIVLYVLNRIIYRTKEMVGDDVPFPCHGEDEIAKILWKNGEAIGFYSVKPEGSLCKTFLTHRYQIPVMDTIFIRKDYRGHGHGLQILEDFIVSFRQEIMGLSYPLSPAMFKVCKKYMSLYPDDTELLWEIVGVGSPFQRIQIARKLQAMDLKENHQVEGELNFEDTEDSDIPKEVGMTQVRETMEFMEEEVVKIKITKELQDTPVITLGRNSNLKRKKLEANTEETNEKIIRVEDTEYDVQCAENDPVQEDGKISLNLKESELKDTMETVTHDSAYPKKDNTRLHCEGQNKLIPETTQMSETENKQVPEMTPAMEIQSLKWSDLQPIECQQVVEVEIVNMSLETDELKEKAEEVNESKNDIDKEILLHGRETSEGIVEVKKDQTDMAEMINNEDIKDEVEMVKRSVGKNIVDDREEIENDIAGTLEVTFLGKKQTQQVKEKDIVEETGLESLHEREQVIEDQDPSPNNKEENVTTMIQQEENVNMAFSLGSKWKHGDKRRSNYETPSKPTRRLKDQTAESELTKSVLRSSSKKTFIASSKQICTRQSKSIKQPELLKHIEEPKLIGLKQTESQSEKEQIENLTAEDEPNKIQNENCYGDVMETHTDTAVEEEIESVRITTEKAQWQCAAETVEEQEEEPGSETGLTEDNSEWEENEATTVTPLRRSRKLKDQAAGRDLTKNVLRRSVQLKNQATPQQRQIKAMIHLEDPKQQIESKNNEMNIILGSEVAVGEHMESETVHVFAENDPKNRISVVQNTCVEGISLDKVYIEAEEHENPRKSTGNDVEENKRKENFTEQDKIAPEDIKHGETEQMYTSECVKEDEDTIQEDSATTEMAHREDLMETTSTLTLQEASAVFVDVINVHPNLTGEFCSTSAASQEKRSNKLELRKHAVDIPEEVKEELQTEAVEVENIEKLNPTEDNLSHINPAAKDTDVDESRVVNSIIEDEASKLNEKYSDECKMGEESKTEKSTLQNPSLTQESDHNECLETATHVQCILHHHNSEQDDELATDLAPEEVREKGVESTSMFTLHQSDLHMDFQRQSSENETDGNETTQSQKGEMLIKDNAANEDKVLVEINVTEPVTERKDEEGAKEAAAMELGMDNTLITNNAQDGNILAEEDVKGHLKETQDTTLKGKYASAELASKKPLVEITTSVQGDSVQESRNLRPSSVIVKSIYFQNVHKETKVNKNTEEEIDEEDETVFIRHLRGRTVTVTPRRRSKRISQTNVVELEMDGHVTKFCHEIVAVQSTEESRTAVLEIHEINSKYDNKEIPAVSEAERKDQQQEKDKPGNDVDKMEKVTDGRKDVVEETVGHKEVETKEGKILVEVDLADENQEKEVRNAHSKQESDQQDNALEEMLLEKTFEKERSKRVKEKCFEEAKYSTINTLITEAVHDHSEDAEGVEIKALRKRTITIKPASFRKSKQFCRQDQGKNDGQTHVWANNQHSATVDATEMEVADVRSQEENKTNDQGKAEEIKDTNTVGEEISHKDEDQGNTREEETSRNANNSQDITVTEDKSKFLNVSEEVTHTKVVEQELDKVKEKREKHSAMEDIMESVNNAGKADKVAGKPQDVKDSQEEQEQSEENAKEITESWVTLHETFTLELDKEIDSNNTECNQVIEETKASGQESEKEITYTEEEYGVMTKRFLRGRKSAAASPAEGPACTRRELMLDFQSEMEDKSGAEEVKEVISGKKEKKPQQKRTAVDELTPRRSKRLARAEIM